MKGKFTISAVFPTSPEAIFKAWLSSKEHSAMTGSAARVQNRVGGRFSAWDGYITGMTLELIPHSRIVQAWRTGEFSQNDPDSRIELSLKAVKAGTKVTLTHSEIPEGQAESYRSGWEEWYFAPMRAYFAK